MQPGNASPARAGFRVDLDTPEGPQLLFCGADEYVWDVAARNGIPLPAMCHQGRCLTCAAKLLSGAVDDWDADSYFTADEEEGFVLLCKAKPRSDLKILTHQDDAMRRHRLAEGLPAPYG